MEFKVSEASGADIIASMASIVVAVAATILLIFDVATIKASVKFLVKNIRTISK